MLAATQDQLLEQAAERLGIDGRKPGESLRQFEQRVDQATPVNPQQRTNENREQFQQRLDQAAQRLGLEGQHPGENLQDFANRVAAASNSGVRCACGTVCARW